MYVWKHGYNSIKISAGLKLSQFDLQSHPLSNYTTTNKQGITLKILNKVNILNKVILTRYHPLEDMHSVIQTFPRIGIIFHHFNWFKMTG